MFDVKTRYNKDNLEQQQYRQKLYEGVLEQHNAVKLVKGERLAKIKMSALERVMEKVDEENEARHYASGKIQEMEVEEIELVQNLKKTQQRIKIFEQEIRTFKQS